jgi:16S rRNA (cytidine1402-2'-O)-methyltransferase
MSLYLVATPIGNLEDMTYRAVRTLTEVDFVLAEDTRVSRRLLDHYNIAVSLYPYHDHNKEKATPAIIRRLSDGQNAALITDAGTPGIADPAFYLVREAIANRIAVSALPGPCAAVAALTASGLPCDRFIFENFLPVKSGKRRRVLETFKNEKRTVILYESPYRIVKVLADIAEVLGEIPVVLGRELTKLHEEFLRGAPAELLAHFAQSPPRGEFVILLNAAHTKA